MNDDMTYCTNIDCPYSQDCDRSVRLIADKAGIYSFADFSDVCERYAKYKSEDAREEIADE